MPVFFSMGPFRVTSTRTWQKKKSYIFCIIFLIASSSVTEALLTDIVVAMAVGVVAFSIEFLVLLIRQLWAEMWRMTIIKKYRYPRRTKETQIFCATNIYLCKR